MTAAEAERDALRAKVTQADHIDETRREMIKVMSERLSHAKAERDVQLMKTQTAQARVAESESAYRQVKAERDALRATITQAVARLDDLQIADGGNHCEISWEDANVLESVGDDLEAALASDGRDDPEDIAESREWARSRRDAQRRAQDGVSDD